MLSIFSYTYWMFGYLILQKPIQISCPLLVGLFFSLLICRSYLHILNMNILTEICIVNIFSQCDLSFYYVNGTFLGNS